MLKKFLLDILFPQFCLGCRKEGSLVCQDCLSIIEVLEYDFCPFCKKPRRVFNEGKCSNHRKMKLNGLFAAVSYKDKMANLLIKKFKYEPFLKTLSEPLSSLIIAHFILTQNNIFQQKKTDSFFIPVPISSRRKRWRGYNQSEEIAKILSIFYQIPLSLKNFIKTHGTEPQVELSLEERQTNLKDVFKIKNPGEFQGKTIFLVDDVFTSGATMEECARTLKEIGAKQVWGIAVAREPLD